jgi:Mg2+-importing ATPase
VLVVIAVLVIPFTPVAALFGFIRLPVAFYGWMVLIVGCYIVTAEMAKKWFYKKLSSIK